MKILQIVATVFLVFFSFNVNATEKIESDVSGVLSSCGESPASDSSPQNKKIQIAFLRGSPMDAMNAPQAGEDFLKITKNLLIQKGFEVRTQSAHHTSWEKVCESFKNNPDHRVILVGHSYGSSGAVKISNCLKKSDIETEALISVSSFDLFAGVDVSTMPSHVRHHLNLSVKDPLIPGYKNHKAENPNLTHIINKEAKLSKTAWPHLAAAGKLLPLMSLYTVAVIEGQLSKLELPELVQDNIVNTSLGEYWKCPLKQQSTEEVSKPTEEKNEDSEVSSLPENENAATTSDAEFKDEGEENI